jgi:hypothetical protein
MHFVARGINALIQIPNKKVPKGRHYPRKKMCTAIQNPEGVTLLFADENIGSS